MNFIRTCAGSSICTYFNNLKYAKDKLRTCTYHYIAVAVSINMYTTGRTNNCYYQWQSFLITRIDHI